MTESGEKIHYAGITKQDNPIVVFLKIRRLLRMVFLTQ